MLAYYAQLPLVTRDNVGKFLVSQLNYSAFPFFSFGAVVCISTRRWR